MKTRNIINAAIAVLLAAVLFVGAIYLAIRHRCDGKQNDLSIIDSQTSGDLLYFISNNTVMRYDYPSARAVRLCGHKTDNTDCELENVGGTLRLYGNRLYFCFRTEDDIFKYSIGYYDLESGDIHRLDAELSIRLYGNFSIYDGYVYYIDGRAVKRIPADGGQSERLCEVTYSEQFIMAADGNIYTSSGLSLSSSTLLTDSAHIYSYDTETMEKKTVSKFSTISINPIGDVVYRDGKIYLSIAETVKDQDKASMISYIGSSSYLWCIDTATDTAKKLIDTPISDFFLNDGKIFYIPQDDRQVYAPGMDNEEMGDMYPTNRGASIHECDLDGGNDRVVYTDQDIAVMSMYMIRGRLFGHCIGRTLETDKSSFYALIDLDTDELRVIDMPEQEKVVS